jgi:hypothetical protein
VAIVDNEQGIVAISGITPPNQDGFVGVGTMATILFTGRSEGRTSLTVDFEKGATADSNIVLSGTSDDVLSQVYNSDVTVVGVNGQISERETKAASCDGYVQYCQTTDGKTGRQTCSKGVIVNNRCSFDPILTVSCEVCKTE